MRGLEMAAERNIVIESKSFEEGGTVPYENKGPMRMGKL